VLHVVPLLDRLLNRSVKKRWSNTQKAEANLLAAARARTCKLIDLTAQDPRGSDRT
jgi:hypothetical protein